MRVEKQIKTAESVSPKHPDKICDRIADAILDTYLRNDPMSRVAVEVMGGHGVVNVTGEVTSQHEISPDKVYRIVKHIGGLHDTDNVRINIRQQSREIAQGVDDGGAGDQGIMVGYACLGNDEFIPDELYLARSLNKFIYALFPQDGKTQITLNEEGQITHIVASWANVSREQLIEEVRKWQKTISTRYEADVTQTICNPAGDWTISGFDADTGLTGRKIAVDNYGPAIPIGGGSFSGKDATKVDRSGAYKARSTAIRELAKAPLDVQSVTVRVAYAIGQRLPLQATAILTYKDGSQVQKELDKEQFRPNDIIREFKLREPIFEKTAEYGHFGNDSFPWER
jgi:S-adenosylmethionine synthetase